MGSWHQFLLSTLFFGLLLPFYHQKDADTCVLSVPILAGLREGIPHMQRESLLFCLFVVENYSHTRGSLVLVAVADRSTYLAEP